MENFQFFLTPVDESLFYLEPNSIGNKIKFTVGDQFQQNSIVIIGCPDLRGMGNKHEFSNLKGIREEFYRLIWNDWSLSLYDLGDIIPGSEWKDTHFILQNLLKELIKLKVFPLILGGGMNLNYSVYKGLSYIDLPLNFTAIDSSINLNPDKTLDIVTSENYLSKMIMAEPNLLFNFTNLGYQSYFVSQSTLNLFNNLDYTAIRLGNITEDIKEVEPILRNSDFAAINLNAVESIDGLFSVKSSPNGFTNREICTIARYMGLSTQIKVAGIYNFLGYSHNKMHAKLVSEILWYIIDGKNLQQFYEGNDYIKYLVVQEDKELIFLKDKYIDRWWLKINFDLNNHLSISIPCSEKDYKAALNGDIPEKYWKAYKKFL